MTINTTQSNIAVLTGSTTVTINEGATELNLSQDINYPSGFGEDNCAVISIGLKNTTYSDKGVSFGTLSEYDSLAHLSSGIGKSVNLKSGALTLRAYFNFNASHSAQTLTFEYKIVLIKIS